MYEQRFYREPVTSKFRLELSYKESDLLISSDKEINKDFAEEILIKYYLQIENHIKNNPSFLKSLSPLGRDPEAPAIIKEMIQASHLTGIGPFSSVAGAISLYLGKELLDLADEVIVENGGDIFLNLAQDKVLGVYSGQNYVPQILKLKIKKRNHSFGIASSSATIGYSLNFGAADLVTVMAKDALVADSFATSLSNRIKKEIDIHQTIEFAKGNDLIDAVVIAFSGKIFLWGDLELVG